MKTSDKTTAAGFSHTTASIMKRANTDDDNDDNQSNTQKLKSKQTNTPRATPTTHKQHKTNRKQNVTSTNDN